MQGDYEVFRDVLFEAKRRLGTWQAVMKETGVSNRTIYAIRKNKPTKVYLSAISNLLEVTNSKIIVKECDFKPAKNNSVV